MLDDGGSEATARSLRGWADAGNWFLFSPPYSRYDELLLPVDEATALRPDGEHCLTRAGLEELRRDARYLRCHEHVARLVLLSWGWDAERAAPAEAPDADAGQGWRESGALGWRLRHLCLSLWLLGQAHLRESAKRFVLSLGTLAPWDEDGTGEALFTLGDAAAARAFVASRPRQPCHFTATGSRTLRDIVVTADIRG
mmetsp:Transcript_17182/g.53819  ORF Transcript_17182/g.53819 Transcript_17182/m.53819 type:complete len:198 (+) Transcript_17182:328-921(+)